MSRRLAIVALGTLLGCTACGFKGPLRLPRRNGTAVRPAATAAPAAQSSPAPRKSEGKKTGTGAATTP